MSLYIFCALPPFPAGRLLLPFRVGGDDGIRTHDPLLAGQVLSQLSYTPVSSGLPLFAKPRRKISLPSVLCVGIELFSHTVARIVSSPLQSLTSVFGMGTGGPSAFVTPTSLQFPHRSLNIEQHLKILLSSLSHTPLVQVTIRYLYRITFSIERR